MRDKIKKILKEATQLKEKIIREDIDTIMKISQLVIDCLKGGGKLILFGNGGSAADSQHIAAELVGRFKKDRQPLAALALTTNTSILSALSNDYNYDIVFSKQLQAHAKRGDLVMGISTSGRAKNVIEGIKKAKEMRIMSIGLTGGDGGNLAKLADISLIVPSSITARIQEAHITIGHIICELVEEALFKNQK